MGTLTTQCKYYFFVPYFFIFSNVFFQFLYRAWDVEIRTIEEMEQTSNDGVDDDQQSVHTECESEDDMSQHVSKKIKKN